jgi:pilus assembly protein CpaB
MRAFTIHTPSVASGVAGFVMPGDHVDVLLTMNGEHNDGTGGGSTITLLQNIEVMAVDQRIEAPAENKVDTNLLRSVTLLVTPDQSLKLDLGQNRGMLHLSLRNPEDLEDAKTRMATLTELRYRQEAPKVVEEPPAPAPAPAPIVEAPKPPPPKPIYIYRAAIPKVVQHETDGTSARKVLTEGSAEMGIPSMDRGPYPMQFR